MMPINYQQMIERNRMRINGEPVTAVVTLNNRLIVMTPSRTYAEPFKRTLRTRIVGGWNRFMLKLRRIYG